jgi:dTDP-4-amino-4,6-dideoxygalactose transaminase
MLDPALSLGGDVLLYPLQRDLSPDLAVIDSLLAQSQRPVRALLVAHFFGIPQRLESLSAWCVARGITLIEDCSHVLFCEYHRPPGTGLFGDFVASSPYKFVPSPDGGLLYSRQGHRLDDIQTRAPSVMAELRGIANAVSKARQRPHAARACDTTRIDAELAVIVEQPLPPSEDLHQHASYSADYLLTNEGLGSLRYSRRVCRHADIGEIARRRRENYHRWTEALANIPRCRPLFPHLPDGCIPYMFPLYIELPNPHFFWLKRLGVPIWRWDSIAVSQCSTALDYRRHLLHLPCHQSLSETELDWMIAAITKAMLHPVPGVA